MVSQYDYSVNPLGQRTNVSTSGTAFPATPSWAWGYNSKGEVVKADSSNNIFDRAYQFDGIGNRLRAATGSMDPKAYKVFQTSKNQFLGWALPEQEKIHDVENNNKRTVFEIDMRYYTTSNGVRGWIRGTGNMMDGYSQFYQVPDYAPELLWEPDGLIQANGCTR